MLPKNRRGFLKESSALAAFSLLSSPAAANVPVRKATDIVQLGRSGLRLSRLGYGVGDGKSGIFKAMGQESFTRLVRHAYERGIRYFDMDPTHILPIFSTAMKGIDRDTYTLTVGTNRPTAEEIPGLVDRIRKALDTDYVDGVLITAIGKADWRESFKPLRDVLGEAKARGLIRAHGVSVHGFEGMQTLPEDDWTDFAMISVNHRGAWMDGPSGAKLGDEARRDMSMPVIRRIHEAGIGVVSMKTFNNNGFENDGERRKSIKFILDSGCVDAMPIRFERLEQIDDVIAMIASA